MNHNVVFQKGGSSDSNNSNAKHDSGDEDIRGFCSVGW